MQDFGTSAERVSHSRLKWLWRCATGEGAGGHWSCAAPSPCTGGGEQIQILKQKAHELGHNAKPPSPEEKKVACLLFFSLTCTCEHLLC